MRARSWVLPLLSSVVLAALLLAAGVPAPPAMGAASTGARPAGSAGDRAAGGLKVRVMTFNIRHGTDEDDDLDLESVADDIESAKAQIVGLQEVDRHRSARSNFVDQAKWLARRLDMQFAFGLNRKIPPQGGRKKPGLHGVVVLSKFPILSARNHMLTNIRYAKRPTKQRSMLEVVIDIKGTKISFYNTHLDNQRSEQRQSQVKEILAVARRSNRPSILVGDFNAGASSPEMRLVKTRFTDVVAKLGEEEDTFPYEDPDRRIDYILTWGQVAARWAEVIDTGSSDHMPVLAGLTIAKSAPPPKAGTVPKPAPAQPVPPRIKPSGPVWF
ncbi:endonuclease/exonuclease/phosphatase family protein [Arthrobacter sp. GCM10027362]|uniref:endonuclease/exonuclease/phosphatase family protein n=1 Tax=Arthrobacter sp. GCM10027362 TaxID=3273379 RepID=UPI003641B6B4